MNDVSTPDLVTHEQLRSMLEQHVKYIRTKGQVGREVDLSLCLIEDYDFSGLNLAGIHAQSAIFRRCRFVGCDLYGVDFGSVIAPNADFQGATLAKAEFFDADLRGTCFDQANLIQAYFINSDLRNASFRGADLRDTTISDCEMEGAAFDDAVSTPQPAKGEGAVADMERAEFVQ